MSTEPITLTPLELYVLRDVADGRTTAHTAGRLHLATGTIANTRTSLYRRLGVPNMAAAVATGFRKGWLS